VVVDRSRIRGDDRRQPPDRHRARRVPSAGIPVNEAALVFFVVLLTPLVTLFDRFHDERTSALAGTD